MRIFRKTTMERTIPNGQDEVVGHVAIPAGGKLNNVWGEVSIHGGAVSYNHSVSYAFRGYLCELGDWDQANTVDALWDALVPKDVDISGVAGTEQLDMERRDTDIAPIGQIGKVQLESLLNIPGPAEKVFTGDGIMTLAKSAGVHDGTGLNYIPTTYIPVRIKKRYAVRSHSYLMFGVSKLDIPGQTSTIPVVIDDHEWFMLMYLEYVLEQAWPQIVGLTELGAESPFSDLAAFLEELVEPEAVYETAGYNNSTALVAVAKFTYDISVPGRPKFNQISGG